MSGGAEAALEGVPRVPPSSVDVAFAKAKTPGRRALTYEQFLFALQLLALEVFSNDEPLAAAQRIFDVVVAAGGPVINSSAAAGAASAPSIFTRLTDTSLFTGAHKHRFDASGHGLGIRGRDDVPDGADARRVRGNHVPDLSAMLRPGLP